jgi:uncharacterized protein YdeI (YjbR/CyaY-like superfamily)
VAKRTGNRSAREAETLPENAVCPRSRAEWRRWLAKHHTRPNGVWWVYYKKHTGKQRYSYDDMVEEALCFGWIDGLARSLDADRAMLWLSPRKPKSVWSQPNKVRLERVLAAGLMQPAGHAAVDRARANGSWSALDAIDRMEVPDDLARALRAVRGAAANFEAWSKSAKKGMLAWVAQAKRPATRATRIAEVVSRAAANRKPVGP